MLLGTAPMPFAQWVQYQGSVRGWWAAVAGYAGATVPWKCSVAGAPGGIVKGTVVPSTLTVAAAGLPRRSVTALAVIDCDAPTASVPENSEVPDGSRMSTQQAAPLVCTASV